MAKGVIIQVNLYRRLHLEFQKTDDKNMIYRMAEYHGLVYRKYKLPIEHVVIHLGMGQAKMRSKLRNDEIFTGFELINLHDFNTTQLLSSQVPAVIQMAILSSFQKDQAEAILRLTIMRLKSVVKSPGELNKYLNQLIIISRMRNLEKLTHKTIKDMTLDYDVEQDYLYNLGIDKGVEKERQKALEEKIETIKSLLTIDLSPEQIAEAMSLELDFVLKIKEEINK